MAGLTGATGATGFTGPQGEIGRTGAQGYGGSSTGALGSWTPSWNYTFKGNSDDILRSDSYKAREIAGYVNQNPSAKIAIDGPSKRYVHSVYEALTEAGVPSNKIQTGTFTDPKLRNDHRVDVLVNNQ
jgi:hypothetical protein